MNILSHRGFWKHSSEKNNIVAFERSFRLGFGTETDIRDYNGELVVSHDIADEKSVKLRELFEVYNIIDNSLTLALNVKADGLQLKLKELLSIYNINNYFLFDMSVPECVQYIKQKMTIYTRESEYETSPLFYDDADGIWLDEFHEHWITEDTILKHSFNNKKICIVSPDLHKRDYLQVWQHYKDIESKYSLEDLTICTDYPQEAKFFFNH